LPSLLRIGGLRRQPIPGLLELGNRLGRRRLVSRRQRTGAEQARGYPRNNRC